MGYQIFADATADITEAHLAGLPHVEIIPMQVEVCGKEFTYGPGLIAVVYWGSNR